MLSFRFVAMSMILFIVVFLSVRVLSRKKEPEIDIYKQTLLYDDRVRRYSFYIPPTKKPLLPLVIALHRSQSNGNDFRKMMQFRFEALAQKKKFIMLYPDGYNGNWNDCRKAPTDAAHTENIDDTGFIKTLIDLFIKEHGADPSQVYVTGMSGGGHMAFRLVQEIPEAIAAIAPLLAQIPTPDNSVCDSFDKPMPVFLLHGTNDPISPYEGGHISLFGLFLKQGAVQSADETLNHFSRINGLSDIPVITRIDHQTSNQFRIEKRIRQKKGAPGIQQYIIHGGGHTLPGTDPLPSLFFGKTFPEGKLAEDLITFFMRHSKEKRKEPDKTIDKVALSQSFINSVIFYTL